MPMVPHGQMPCCADAVLVLHGLFIAWVVARRPGGVAPAVAGRSCTCRRRPGRCGSNGRGGICPLTPLELRAAPARPGSKATRGGFIEHYLRRADLPRGPDARAAVRARRLVLVLNVAVYVAPASCRRRRAARRTHRLTSRPRSHPRRRSCRARSRSPPTAAPSRCNSSMSRSARPARARSASATTPAA
ncbi:MAG: DUF2784 domain-containing protein [Comamonadaceae bacterium]|nr:DUF2784 domain-containing protein [Comamonadaceae bacterium]